MASISHYLCFGIRGALHRRYGVLKRVGLLPECAYAVAKYLRQENPQHADTQNFLIRWLIRNGIMDSLQLSLDDEGNLLYNAASNLSTLI